LNKKEGRKEGRKAGRGMRRDWRKWEGAAAAAAAEPLFYHSLPPLLIPLPERALA